MRKAAILIHKKSQAFHAELVRILNNRQSTNFKAAGKCEALKVLCHLVLGSLVDETEAPSTRDLGTRLNCHLFRKSGSVKKAKRKKQQFNK